jgi:hypothetical protein
MGQGNVWFVAAKIQFALILHTGACYEGKRNVRHEDSSCQSGATILGSGVGSGITSLTAGTVARVPHVLLHDRGGGPIVDISPEPGILHANLYTHLVSSLVMGHMDETKNTQHRGLPREVPPGRLAKETSSECQRRQSPDGSTPMEARRVSR